jgi:hypothetical protein
MIRHNLEDWLVEFDIPAAGGQPDPMGGGPPMSDPTMGMPGGDPNITNTPQDMAPQQAQEPNQDVNQDPQAPDIPEPQEGDDDFEIWKKNYFKESIKGNVEDLLEMMSPMREKESLLPHQRKFIEDNWNIQLIRRNENVSKTSQEIRKSVRDQLDQNNPGTSVVEHLHRTLDTRPMLNNKFIQMLGYGAYKGELHRKYIAALTGSVEVSSGHERENIIFNENEYSIKISTRLNAEWGEVPIGSWSLREDDPERYLSEPELRRLQEGSPEEKEVLRKRIVVESIAKQFEERAYIIHVVSDEGTIYALGWDVANCIRSAYSEGKLVVRTRTSDNSEAMIDDEGNIIPLIDLNVYFVRETGQQDEEGKPETEEIEFMERRNGMLFLSAGLPTIQDASNATQGMNFKEIPYQGNPSDLKNLRRCVFSTHDLLMKECV